MQAEYTTLVGVDPLGDLKSMCKNSTDKMLRLPKQIYERSSTKAFLRLTKSVVLIVLAYVLLTQLPWFLLPIGWIFAGTTFASLLAVGYACRGNNFFNNHWLNHFVGQICLVPLMIPFESWQAKFTKEKECFKTKVMAYLSVSHFWWCTSLWQFLTSHVDAFFSIYGLQARKRLIGNLCMLYLFCALFFPLMTYNLGLWGLAKYYIIPLMVYHFWASSFLKTSSLLEMLELEHSDFVTLAYYKYPKWVEFLSGELNYAFSSLQRLTTSEEVNPGPSVAPNSNPDEKEATPQPTSEPVYDEIPFYNIQEAIKFIKDSKLPKSLNVKLHELSFVSLLKSRTGGLIEAFDQQSVKLKEFKDVIAEMLSAVNWVTTSYLFLTPVFALYGLITLPYYWQTFVLAFFHYIGGGLGITAGYHRLWSHRAYDAHPIFRYFLLFCGTGSFEMSVLEWCNDHRAHHRYTDTDKDPYSIQKGFWYAHMGWLLWKRTQPVNSDISDLKADRWLVFQDKYYPYLAVAQGFLLPTLIAGIFWGDWLGGFLIAGVATRVFISHATFCVNSLAHYYGDFTYSDQRSPRDSWFVGLATFGEGYHNFHHEFPYDYRNGAHFRAFDPTKWLVWILYWVGLTYNLKKFSKETIRKGKLQMQERELQRQMAALHWGPPDETLPVYTAEDVKREVEQNGEKLMVCEGYVHDVRAFITEHPGGSGILKPFIGKDVTKQFNGSIYNHSNAARNILRTLRIAKMATKEKDQ